MPTHRWHQPDLLGNDCRPWAVTPLRPQRQGHQLRGFELNKQKVRDAKSHRRCIAPLRPGWSPAEYSSRLARSVAERNQCIASHVRDCCVKTAPACWCMEKSPTRSGRFMVLLVSRLPQRTGPGRNTPTNSELARCPVPGRAWRLAHHHMGAYVQIPETSVTDAPHRPGN